MVDTPISEALPKNLPRLAYVGEVRVESSLAGSLLLHRLLSWYPADRLEIWQPQLSAKEHALPNVDYHALPVLLRRLKTTRLAGWRGRLDLISSSLQANCILPSARRFQPQAILTVAHGEAWAIADHLAQRLQIPLHLVCHDDVYAAQTDSAWRKFAESRFTQVYQRAASRLCVSSPMEREYRERYGAPGTVLLPSRGPECPRFSDPPAQVVADLEAPRVAFAGSLYGIGSERPLRQMADILAKLHGRLLIYGHDESSRADTHLLNLPNVEFRGKLPSKRLIETLRSEADILFLPMTFEVWMRTNMRLCFPSKLTDYSAVGLPIYVHGPEDCAAAVWATENPEVASVVTDPSSDALEAGLKQLIGDPALRRRLAVNALQVGAAQFSFSVARNTLTAALTKVAA
jgi:glycosyltransferase involved in cell wall biosynthesis